MQLCDFKRKRNARTTDSDDADKKQRAKDLLDSIDVVEHCIVKRFYKISNNLLNETLNKTFNKSLKKQQKMLATTGREGWEGSYYFVNSNLRS